MYLDAIPFVQLTTLYTYNWSRNNFTRFAVVRLKEFAVVFTRSFIKPKEVAASNGVANVLAHEGVQCVKAVNQVFVSKVTRRDGDVFTNTIALASLEGKE